MMTTTASPSTDGVDDSVDVNLAEHLKTMTPKQRERLLRKLLLAKKKKKPRHSVCRPRAEPVGSWKPKDTATAKAVLALLADGVGVVPSNIEGTAWDFKIMSNELASAVTGMIPAQAVRSTVATTSMLVTSLLARIVELASRIQADEQAVEAKFELQDHRTAAGFARSRGSGLAANHAGLALVKRATTDLRSRLDMEP